MALDWIDFFNRHGVEFVTSGPSVTRNNVAIHCPFCGNDDPSFHMGVSLLGKGYRCWRRPDQHRGRNPVRLIKALIRCSTQEAERIAGAKASVPTDLLDRVKAMLEPEDDEEVSIDDEPVLPSTFLPLTNGLRSSWPYLDYLEERGYGEEMLPYLDKLGLSYCPRGTWKGRIMFPLYYHGRLISWTGRTIWPAENLRYKTLSIEWDKAKRGGDKAALAPATHHVLWFDRLIERGDAESLVLVEGPFDALHVDVLGKREGIASTCLFTSTPTDEQVLLLYELLPLYRRKFLLLDSGTLAASRRVGSQLISLGLEPRLMPTEIKDPGSREFSLATLRKTLAGYN